MRAVVLFGAVALVAIACTRTQPAPAPAPVASATTGRPAEAAPRRRRVPPNPMQQDTVRRAMVDSVLATIAGRENEPAGTVFRNVKESRDMPAGEFVRMMDTQYGRGLGWTCNNCHVVGKWDDDSNKHKRIARQMQAMQDYINKKQLSRVKELDEEYDKVTCVMCHRGASAPAGTMPVPPAPPATTAPGGAP
jgi:hypothetical protein